MQSLLLVQSTWWHYFFFTCPCNSFFFFNFQLLLHFSFLQSKQTQCFLSFCVNHYFCSLLQCLQVAKVFFKSEMTKLLATQLLWFSLEDRISSSPRNDSHLWPTGSWRKCKGEIRFSTFTPVHEHWITFAEHYVDKCILHFFVVSPASCLRGRVMEKKGQPKGIHGEKEAEICSSVEHFISRPYHGFSQNDSLKPKSSSVSG